MDIKSQNIVKLFAFSIEERLSYYDDYDTLTKVEILELVKQIMKEEYCIEGLKE